MNSRRWARWLDQDALPDLTPKEAYGSNDAAQAIDAAGSIVGSVIELFKEQ